jgi:biopolymer transport protein ExbD
LPVQTFSGTSEFTVKDCANSTTNYIFGINPALKSRLYPELSTGAMSDIAFLLLIFFVTTPQILDERAIQVILPRFDATGPQIPDSEVFYLHINAANKILAATVLTDIPGLERVLNAAIALPDQNRFRNLVISLHCDRECDYNTFLGVL